MGIFDEADSYQGRISSPAGRAAVNSSPARCAPPGRGRTLNELQHFHDLVSELVPSSRRTQQLNSLPNYLCSRTQPYYYQIRSKVCWASGKDSL